MGHVAKKSGISLTKVGQKLFLDKTHRTLLLCGICLVVHYCSMTGPSRAIRPEFTL